MPSPHPRAIEQAVLNGLTHVMRAQGADPLEIGDGPGDFEHPIVRPGRERQAGHGLLENPCGRIVQDAPTPDLPGSHVAVRPQLGSVAKTVVLQLTGGRNAGPDGVARFARSNRSQVPHRNGGHLDVEIDAVQQGARHAGTIPGHGPRIARAPVSLRPVQPARAPVRTTIAPISSEYMWSLNADESNNVPVDKGLLGERADDPS